MQRKLGSGARPDAQLDSALQLQKISTLLIQEGNIEFLYDRVLDAAVNLLSADRGSLQVFSAQRNGLELLAYRGFHPDSVRSWQFVSSGSTTTCGIALFSGARVIIDDINNCHFNMSADNRDAYRRSGIRAVQSTPLISRSGELLGMISTHWCTPHLLTEDEMRPLDVLARQAADLIERTRNEALLRIREEQSRWLAAIVESSDDAIISKNVDGVITSWNKAAERIYGYRAEEIIGKTSLILIPEEQYVEEAAITARMHGGERIDHYETTRRRKTGELIAVSLTISPIKDTDGKIIGVSKIARNITEHKRIQAQVKIIAHEAQNILASAQAPVHLSNGDTPEAIRAIEGRIKALSSAVEILEAIDRIASLSPREREVLDGLVIGSSNKQIAYDLQISARTVEVHRARMLERLGVRGLGEAVRLSVMASLGR